MGFSSPDPSLHISYSFCRHPERRVSTKWAETTRPPSVEVVFVILLVILILILFEIREVRAIRITIKSRIRRPVSKAVIPFITSLNHALPGECAVPFIDTHPGGVLFCLSI